MTDQGALTRPEPLDVRASALFLDLDGTLTPIAPRPHDIGPLAERTALLHDLAKRLDGRLAIVSGRTIAEIDRILEGAVVAVAGVHGLERRGADGRTERTPSAPGLEVARRELPDLRLRHPKLLVEDKGLSLAIHYRQTPRSGAAVQAFARGIAARTGLVVQGGDEMAELRGPGPSKGDAIKAFMQAAPFAGAAPIFLGDDLTDENGFAAVRDLGGEGILVGGPRDSAAARRLPDVAAVLTWLRAAISGSVTA